MNLKLLVCAAIAAFPALAMEKAPSAIWQVNTELLPENKRWVQSQVNQLRWAAGTDQKKLTEVRHYSLEPIIHPADSDELLQKIIYDHDTVKFANEIFESEEFSKAYKEFKKNKPYANNPEFASQKAMECAREAFNYLKKSTESESHSAFICPVLFASFYRGLTGATTKIAKSELKNFVFANFFEDNETGKKRLFGTLLAASIASNQAYKASNPWSHSAFNWSYRASNWWNNTSNNKKKETE